jgi:hypothetical protein
LECREYLRRLQTLFAETWDHSDKHEASRTVRRTLQAEKKASKPQTKPAAPEDQH